MRPEAFAPLSAETVDALRRDLGPLETPVQLSLPYWSPPMRAGALTIVAFVAELRGVPLRVSEPMLGAIRLQWWREALDEVFSPGRVRRHPLVEALAMTLRDTPGMAGPLRSVIEGGTAYLGPGAFETAAAAIDGFATIDGAGTAALAALGGAEDLSAWQAAGAASATLLALRLAADGAPGPLNEHGVEHPIDRLRRASPSPDWGAASRDHLSAALSQLGAPPVTLQPLRAALRLPLKVKGDPRRWGLRARAALFAAVLAG